MSNLSYLILFDRFINKGWKHKHDAYSEHPIAVKYHGAWFAAQNAPKSNKKSVEKLTLYGIARNKIFSIVNLLDEEMKKKTDKEVARQFKLYGEEAIKMLLDYNDLVSDKGYVPEQNLNIYLRKVFQFLDKEFPGDFDPKESTEPRIARFFFRVKELIKNAKTYPDKIIAFDSFMSLAHHSGSALPNLYPFLNSPGLIDKIEDWLDFLAGRGKR